MSELADTLRAKVRAVPLDWDKALADARKNRETHVRWRKFLMANPDYPTEDVGDVRHHAKAIEGYNNIIGCLAAHTLLAVAQVAEEEDESLRRAINAGARPDAAEIEPNEPGGVAAPNPEGVGACRGSEGRGVR